MQSSGSVTKGQFAALRGVTPGRVSQWIAEGKIAGAALEGEGRNARVNVAAACRQLGVTLDPLQAAVNGKLPPATIAVPVAAAAAAEAPGLELEGLSDQRRMAKARADQAELAAERSRRELEAERGRYMLAAEAEAAWSRMLGGIIAELEAAVPQMAGEVARALGSSEVKVAVTALRAALRAWRARLAETAARQLAGQAELVEDPDAATGQEDAA